MAGCTYRVSCWARVARTNEGSVAPPPAPVASNNLGAYFTRAQFGTASTTVLTGFQPLAMLLPAGRLLTDTLNYTYLSNTFVAQGGEQFFTLGNFQPNASTTVRPLRPSTYPLWAVYAIDDVVIETVPPAGLALKLGPDQWLGSCAGTGPATLTAPPGFQDYRWSTGQTTASISVSQPGRYVATTNFGCGTLKDSLEVRRYDPRMSPPLLVSPPALCPGQSLTLSAVPGFSAYQWAGGPTRPHPASHPTGPLPPHGPHRQWLPRARQRQRVAPAPARHSQRLSARYTRLCAGSLAAHRARPACRQQPPVEHG